MATTKTRNESTETTNGNRRLTDPTAFEVVEKVPAITRTGRKGTRKSKWDAVVAHLRENPGVVVRYEDVSSSLGNDLQKRFYLKAENRNVREKGNRADLYLQYDPEFEAQLRAKESEKDSEAGS
jgi:hypothetical protein